MGLVVPWGWARRWAWSCGVEMWWAVVSACAGVLGVASGFPCVSISRRFGRESGGDPLRGQHHRVPSSLGGLVGHEVRECDQVRVAGRITDAVPRAGAGAREGVAEQPQSALSEQLAGQRFGRLWLGNRHAGVDPVNRRGVWCASAELVQFQRPKLPTERHHTTARTGAVTILSPDGPWQALAVALSWWSS